MHGYAADLVARDFHVTLRLGGGGAQLRHEALQGCGGLALVVQREFEKLVEGIVGLVPEAFQYPLPAAVAAEQPSVEGERRLKREATLAMLQAAQGGPNLPVRPRVIR